MGEPAQDLFALNGGSLENAIVYKAAAVASREGFEALTLNDLGNHGLSERDIRSSFGSIVNLRLAVIEFAAREIDAAVYDPSIHLGPGLPHLYGLMCRWLDYLSDACNAGGCFLLSAVPFQSAAPGPPRDRLVQITRQWFERLCVVTGEAIEHGHIRKGVPAEQLVSELHALLYGAHWSRIALDDAEAFSLARDAVERRLRSVATPAGIRASKARRVARAETVFTA